MENIYTIKESLIYNTLYVQTVPQNIYQHKSFSRFLYILFKKVLEQSGSSYDIIC